VGLRPDVVKTQLPRNFSSGKDMAQKCAELLHKKEGQAISKKLFKRRYSLKKKRFGSAYFRHRRGHHEYIVGCGVSHFHVELKSPPKLATGLNPSSGVSVVSLTRNVAFRLLVVSV
jgi:ribosomal protein L32E